MQQPDRYHEPMTIIAVGDEVRTGGRRVAEGKAKVLHTWYIDTGCSLIYIQFPLGLACVCRAQRKRRSIHCKRVANIVTCF